MNRFFLTKDIEIKFTPASTPISETNFIFSSGGLLAAAGKFIRQTNTTLNNLIDESIGSETWFTENTDFFRFYDSGELHSIILDISEENAPFDYAIQQSHEGYFSIKLCTAEKFFIVTPQVYRSFNSSRRELYCFTDNIAPKTVFKITANLSLMFNDDNVFAGWIFYNPLENITTSFQGEKDTIEVDDETYKIFADFFDIVSKNEDALHDDYETVIEKLLIEIGPERTSKICGNIRRQALETTQKDLKEYFLDT
ncbi:hypothetical protein [Massilia aquatica]|uniref:Uncharacterized protein n=1 Tax=Massilia aquatica TaxID=2609000 RepID=A0ABX0M9G2_9BURK|nr:hypothetical protein [Massilia aquatica]NHZ42954.1 hypothetical protein [Massilia aquatica]